jgi:cardiolipin synthase A/B
MLEDVIAALIESGAAQAVATFIRDGRLTKHSRTPALETTFPGQPRAQQTAAALLKVWNTEFSDASCTTMARLIECIASFNSRERQRNDLSRLVWTGPEAPGSYPRSSRQIVREIVMGAQKEIWLTAYWIAGPRDGEGIVNDIVELLANASVRGLDVALALDGYQRASGETNFDVLRALWPPGARFPRLYTWSEASLDPYLKLHAKALVADRADALVTSANLTMHALERNMELGVRLKGRLAHEIAAQLDSLVSSRILTPVAF